MPMISDFYSGDAGIDYALAHQDDPKDPVAATAGMAKT